MTLTGPGGSSSGSRSTSSRFAGGSGLGGAGLVDLPVFHPCVRLAKWREQPGVLSFVPPDGRFTLAGYEVDLMPSGALESGGLGPAAPVKLPVTLEIKTGLGLTGADFEVRLQINRVFGPASAGGGSAAGLVSGFGSGPVGGSGPGGARAGTPAAPVLQDVSVSVPLPAGVRNLSEIRPTKGDATYNPGDRALEWVISNKELNQAGVGVFALRCTVVGQAREDEEDDEDADPTGFGFGDSYHYDETYQASTTTVKSTGRTTSTTTAGVGDVGERDERKVAQNRMLMPGSASVSFAVKGWLASGIKVESIQLDQRKSRGLGEGVKPYKGVKYLTVSRGGVEIRC
jgi:AP-3 complex subunit mu